MLPRLGAAAATTAIAETAEQKYEHNHDEQDGEHERRTGLSVGRPPLPVPGTRQTRAPAQRCATKQIDVSLVEHHVRCIRGAAQSYKRIAEDA